MKMERGLIESIRVEVEVNQVLEMRKREFYRGLGRYGECECCGDEAIICQDHSHVNGMIRGKICVKCNNGIGLFADDPKRLYQAVSYIRRWRKTHKRVKEDDWKKYKYGRKAYPPFPS